VARYPKAERAHGFLLAQSYGAPDGLGGPAPEWYGDDCSEARGDLGDGPDHDEAVGDPPADTLAPGPADTGRADEGPAGTLF
jgi:hypothetical protein